MTQQAAVSPTTPTTNGQTAPATPAAAGEPQITADLDVEGRSVELTEHLRKEQIAEEQAEGDETPPPAAAETPAAAAETPPPEDAAAKERAARLERAKTIEREAHRAKQQLIERDKALRTREAEIERREARARQLEHALDDPDAFLGIAAERVGVEKMIGWLQDQASPEKVAARQAKRVETSVKSEIDKAREELATFKQQLLTERQQIQAYHARAQVEQGFHAAIGGIKEHVPVLAHAISVDPRRVIRDADELTEQLVAEREAAGEGPPTFEDIARELDARYKRFTGAEPARPAAPSQPGQNAAAKAKTVSNRAAAERSSLLSEEEEDLSLDERAERLIRLARKFPDRV